MLWNLDSKPRDSAYYPTVWVSLKEIQIRHALEELRLSLRDDSPETKDSQVSLAMSLRGFCFLWIAKVQRENKKNMLARTECRQ